MYYKRRSKSQTQRRQSGSTTNAYNAAAESETPPQLFSSSSTLERRSFCSRLGVRRILVGGLRKNYVLYGDESKAFDDGKEEHAWLPGQGQKGVRISQ